MKNTSDYLGDVIDLDKLPFFRIEEHKDCFTVEPIGYRVKKLDAKNINLYFKKWAQFCRNHKFAKLKKTKAELFAQFIAESLPEVDMSQTFTYLLHDSNLASLTQQDKINCIDITLLFHQLYKDICGIDTSVEFSSVHSYIKLKSGECIDFGRNTANKNRLFSPQEHRGVMIQNGLRPLKYLVIKTQRRVKNMIKNALS